MAFAVFTEGPWPVHINPALVAAISEAPSTVPPSTRIWFSAQEDDYWLVVGDVDEVAGKLNAALEGKHA